MKLPEQDKTRHNDMIKAGGQCAKASLESGGGLKISGNRKLQKESNQQQCTKLKSNENEGLRCNTAPRVGQGREGASEEARIGARDRCQHEL